MPQTYLVFGDIEGKLDMLRAAAQGNRARWKSGRWRHGHRSETSLPSARSEARTDLIFSLLPQRQFTERSLSHPGAGSGS